ncbi:hypothetical protein NE237_017823 [Protea cynaroides]|uniref:F-box domain-containing protein n=1 Tax=Protea cynaroides TaxID=273540 RepID=A0A9Q0K8Q7_9MAGN|nr:hypothetical protein NE237_017823 [Protea cynaroides]
MNDCSSSSSASPFESSPSAVATDESDSPHSSLLLPNLPDDIALQCIARVPPFYHNELSLVSKSWLSMLRSTVFLSTCDRLNCSRHFLYFNVEIYGSSFKWFALDHNPKNPRNLYPVPPIPSQPIGSTFAVLGPKIYALGGLVNNTLSSAVWIFDSRFNRWESGPKMHIGRKLAIAGVLNGKIYVMGGCGQSTNWAEVFDPVLGFWAPIPSPVEVTRRLFCASAVMEEKFYALAYYQGGVVFDPCDSSWRNAPTELSLRWRGRVVVDGILYCYDGFGKIKGFDLKEGKWKELKGVQRDSPAFIVDVVMANVGGRLFVLWVENRNQTEISCSEVEVSKDSNGGLWGSIVWSEVILAVPVSSYIAACLAVEF